MATEDIAIVPTGLKSYERAVRVAPVYLVSIEDPTLTSKVSYFLATKLDENQFSIKVVGFDLNKKDINRVGANYQEVLNSTDKSLYMELVLPWQRVIKIQNLIFKQK
jgi:hypothetical protein